MTMGKATLVLVTLSALGFGSLVGFSLVDNEPEAAVGETVAVNALVATGGAPPFRYFGPAEIPDGWTEANPGEPFTVGENFVARDGGWKSETVEIALAGDDRVEYKVVMLQGDSFIFRWQVTGEEVYYDFHAHDDAFGEEFFTRYDDGMGAERSGTVIAAYDGQHGWYWQNLESDPATITLEVAGFYDELVAVDLETN